MSGATCYATEEISSGKFGFASDAIYDDTKDRTRILSMLRSNPKRIVENTVLSQLPSTVKTALIVAPLIYGAGRGPVNQRSIQAPEIVKTTLKLGHGFKLGDGLSIWSNIHVQDLASLVCSLVSAAVEKKDGVWNEDGVYNVEHGEMVCSLDAVSAGKWLTSRRHSRSSTYSSPTKPTSKALSIRTRQKNLRPSTLRRPTHSADTHPSYGVRMRAPERPVLGRS